MVSSLLQKQHLVHPFQFLFTKLSLANMTPFFRYQTKTLIFNGSFSFQETQKSGRAFSLIRSLYIELTEKDLLFKDHMNSSLGTYQVQTNLFVQTVQTSIWAT